MVINTQLTPSVDKEKDIGDATYKNKNIVYFAIFSALMAFILVVESIFILISFFWKGIFKKEILSQKSDLGFDIDIILKP